jgi:osmoprotectant transport system substrate-binding protein
VDDAGRKALDTVSSKLDTETLATLVKRLVVDKEDASTLAKEWLSGAGIES